MLQENIHNLRQKMDNLSAKQVCDSRQETGEKSVNLFYLTERCNLDCDYCYEQKCRKGLDTFKDATEEEIVMFLQEVAAREPNETSVIRVFGGEPLLRMDLLEFFIRACNEIKPASFGMDQGSFGVAINLITNGVALASMKNVETIQGIIGLAQKYAIIISLDISYDGSGQDRRVFADSGRSSRDAVEKAMDNLTQAGVPFSVSYTVHNTNHENVVEDAIRMCERFNILENIKLGYAFKELVPIYGEEIIHNNSLHHKLIPYAEEVFKRYNVAMCYDMICHVCGKCVKAENTLNIAVPGGKTFQRDFFQEKDWDYFGQDKGV
jgi:sulfatase maturation enzyme AslB (radical SAM superfamily)